MSRWFSNPSPPDLFAARKAEILLVMVRYSRGPVPDAHAVSVVYGSELDRLRSVGDPGFVQKECGVLTPHDGWKYYEVLPGGIRRIWNRPDDTTATGRQAGGECGTGVIEGADRAVEGGDRTALAIEGGKKTSRAGARP